VFHWDTFDNHTLEIGQFDTLADAKTFIQTRYGDRVRSSGADKVDIVDDRGNVVASYPVG